MSSEITPYPCWAKAAAVVDFPAPSEPTNATLRSSKATALACRQMTPRNRKQQSEDRSKQIRSWFFERQRIWPRRPNDSSFVDPAKTACHRHRRGAQIRPSPLARFAGWLAGRVDIGARVRQFLSAGEFFSRWNTARVQGAIRHHRHQLDEICWVYPGQGQIGAKTQAEKGVIRTQFLHAIDSQFTVWKILLGSNCLQA